MSSSARQFVFNYFFIKKNRKSFLGELSEFCWVNYFFHDSSDNNQVITKTHYLETSVKNTVIFSFILDNYFSNLLNLPRHYRNSTVR